MGIKVLKVLFYVIFVLLGILLGYQLALYLSNLESIKLIERAQLWNKIALMLIGALIGLWIAPVVANWFLKLVDRITLILQKLSIQELLSGIIGLILGLIIAGLFNHLLIEQLMEPLSAISIIRQFVKPFTMILVTIFFIYLGILLSLRHHLFGPSPLLQRINNRKSQTVNVKLLDTSAIIDGRIADICLTGFIEGTLIVPKFVLEELQYIADSPDALRRNRGRRGLDILNKMRKDEMKIQIHEKDPEGTDVDSKLIKLAKELNGTIITNDYNLYKVAELHEVNILNINELANALKPVVLPGEELQVQIIREGKETGQGVSYLDDGTMIVIEGGRRYIGENIRVEVTSVLQTVAGKMIFAKPKM